MNLWPLVAAAAVALTTVQLYPQVIKSWRTKQVKDISLGMLVVMILGSTAWLAYGLHQTDLPIITANSLNLLAAITLTGFKLRP